VIHGRGETPAERMDGAGHILLRDEGGSKSNPAMLNIRPMTVQALANP